MTEECANTTSGDEIPEGLRAEIAYHHGVDEEQSHSHGPLDTLAFVCVGILISPILAVLVPYSHLKTTREIRRAKTGDGSDE